MCGGGIPSSAELRKTCYIFDTVTRGWNQVKEGRGILGLDLNGCLLSNSQIHKAFIINRRAK